MALSRAGISTHVSQLLDPSTLEIRLTMPLCTKSIAYRAAEYSPPPPQRVGCLLARA